MSNWAWLSNSLSCQPDSFDNFHQCLAFRSGTELHSTSPAGGQNARLPARTSILEAEEEVFAYLEESDTPDNNVCALAFINPSNTANGTLPLPISQRLYEHVACKFDIASGFLAIVSTGLARYSCGVGVKSKVGKQDDSIRRFVIQQNRSHSCFSIALTFDVPTGRTRAVIFGVAKWLIRVTELFEFLEFLSPVPYGPMVIPTIALELQANWFSGTVNKLQSQIRVI